MGKVQLDLKLVILTLYLCILTPFIGVPVIGYDTEIFPAFFTNNSGVSSPMNVSDPKVIADMLLSQLKLGLNNGEDDVYVMPFNLCMCLCVRVHALTHLSIEECTYVRKLCVCVW